MAVLGNRSAADFADYAERRNSCSISAKTGLKTRFLDHRPNKIGGLADFTIRKHLWYIELWRLPK